MTHRHLRAFVSSRMQELAEERAAVRAALEALYVHAFVYEVDAGARPDSARSTYLAEIDASDLYIGLFWQGYGAYTIEEYEHARLRRKPCLIYVKQDDTQARAPELAAFLQRISAVESGHTVAWFRDAPELATQVGADVARWLASVVRGEGRADTPFQAPALSERHVRRPEVIAHLRARLLPQRAGEAPPARIAVLHGLAGSGKTSLARELAHDAAVLGALPDGVLWVSLGQQPDLRQRLSDWGRALRDGQVGMVGYADAHTAAAQLRALLLERACLLVVDDCWSAEHAKAFDVGGPQCLLIVTTRQGAIASSLGAQRIGVPAMSEADALEILRKRAGDIAAEDLAHARGLAAEVGRLPLALDLLAAQVRRLGSWSLLDEAWRERGPRVLVRSRGAAGRDDNMLDSLELSLAALPPGDRTRFFRLGVFDEDTPFPVSAAAALWDWSAADTADLLAELADRALLERTADASVFSLHDLLHDVARDQLGAEGLVRAHQALLAGYRKRCGQDWASCADDGYLHDHLAAHLAAAGRSEELYRLIGEPWMRAQFRRAYSHRHFARDVERMIAQAAGETPPRLDEEAKGSLIYATLGSLARHVPPRTLALLVRMGQVERAKGMASLLTDARERMDALIAIATALEGRGEMAQAAVTVTEAIDVARGLPDSTLDQERRRAALAGLAPLAARHGLLEAWRAVVDATGAAMLPGPGTEARRRALAQAAVALAEAGHTTDAESIVSELQAAEAASLIVVAPLCALARRADTPAAARELVDRALALTLSVDANPGRDVELMTCVQTLLGLERRDDALETIRAMASSRWRAYAYAAAARAATMPDQGPPLAARALAEVRVIAQEGHTADAAQVLNDTFDAQVLAGDDALSAAVAVALEFEDSPGGEIAVAAASRALATVGRYDEALALAKRLDAQYATGTVGAIAVGFALQGDVASARKLIGTMEPIYRGPVLMELARVHLRSGQVEDARATLQDPAVRVDWRMHGLTELAEALLDRGEQTAAVDVLAAALAGAEVAGDIEGVVAALSEIAEAECARGEPQAARQFALAAAEFTRRSAGWQREAATLSAAVALIACAEIDAAAVLVDELPAPERLMPILVCAARLVHARRADEARTWLNRAGALLDSAASDAERRRAAAWMAEAYARLGERDLATIALGQAQVGLDALSGWDRFDALLDAAPAAARLGESALALDLLLGADAIIDAQTNQLALTATRRVEVVKRMAAIGQLEPALERAGDIPLAPQRAEALTAVAAAKGKQDEPGARELLRAVLALVREKTFGHERASALADAAIVMHGLGIAEGAAAAREAADIAEAANLDAALRSELRRKVAPALHACGAQAEALALWRADLAASRIAGRAQTLQSLAAGAPLLAASGEPGVLERIGRALLAVEAWWSAPSAPAPAAAERSP